jgi:hypothetical protein
MRHSERIAARNSRIVLWEVPNADHCGAISTAGGEFERQVLAWFDNHPAITTSKYGFPLTAPPSKSASLL